MPKKQKPKEVIDESQPLVLLNFVGEISVPKSAIQLRDKALKASKLVLSVKTDEEQRVAVDALRSLATIRKNVDLAYKLVTKPANDMRTDARTKADTFMLDCPKEEKRLQGIINHYQLEQMRKQDALALEASRKQQQEQQGLQRQQEQIEKLRKEAELASNPKQKAKKEDELLDLQLAQEEAAAISSTSLIPSEISKPSGLVVKKNLDFAVVSPLTFLNAYPRFWSWKEEEESYKLRRMDLREELNKSEEEKPIFTLRDKDNIPIIAGLRVFLSIKSHTR